jgi:hypothetical protein
MSLQTGRKAIETYVEAQWANGVPMGMDGHPFTVAAPSVRMTITEGMTRQGSIGRVVNTVNQIGLVTFQIFTAGGTGSDEWRGYAQTLLDLFHGRTLDAAGAVVTSGAQTPLVRFSPPELGDAAHPYIAAQIDGAPHHQSNIICPFVRYELR